MLWQAYLRSSQARSLRMLRDRRALAALATCYILLWLWYRPRLQQTARSLAALGSAARLGPPHAPLFATGKFPAQGGSGARAHAAAQRSASGGSGNGWEDLPALDDSTEPKLDREGRAQLALHSADQTLRPWRTGRTAVAEDADGAAAEEAPGQSTFGSSVAGHGGGRTPGQSDLRGSTYPAAGALRRRKAGAGRVHMDVQRGSRAAHEQGVRVRRTVRAERRGSASAEEEPLGPENPGEFHADRQGLQLDRLPSAVHTRALRYDAFALRVPRFPSDADAAWFASLPWVAARRAANAACPAELALCAGLTAQDGSPDAKPYLSPGASTTPQRFVFWEPRYTSGAIEVVPNGRLVPSDALYSDCGWHSGASPVLRLDNARLRCLCPARGVCETVWDPQSSHALLTLP